MLPWILAVFALCFLLERARPGWRLPHVPSWTVRVLLVNAVQLAVVLLAGVTWERWMAGRSVIHGLRDLPPIAGGLIAYFIATFAFYWWHRWRHEVHFLWLGFHQIHHSPRRLEVITSFYKHPAEMIVNSLLGSAIVYVLLDLAESPEGKGNSEATQTLARALRATPPLSAKNALMGQYLLVHQQITSLLKDNKWGAPLQTDLRATFAELDEAFLAHTPEECCATFGALRNRSSLRQAFGYNRIGNMLLRSVGMSDCFVFPRVREIENTVSEQRRELLNRVEPR